MGPGKPARIGEPESKIEVTQKKLREARFFAQQLHAAHVLYNSQVIEIFASSEEFVGN